MFIGTTRTWHSWHRRILWDLLLATAVYSTDDFHAYRQSGCDCSARPARMNEDLPMSLSRVLACIFDT